VIKVNQKELETVIELMLNIRDVLLFRAQVPLSEEEQETIDETVEFITKFHLLYGSHES
jgi:hypothetical protein